MALAALRQAVQRGAVAEALAAAGGCSRAVAPAAAAALGAARCYGGVPVLSEVRSDEQPLCAMQQGHVTLAADGYDPRGSGWGVGGGLYARCGSTRHFCFRHGCLPSEAALSRPCST